MHASVEAIVNRLFEGVKENDNLRALREEITNNCQEHFTDLLRQGYSPEEAEKEIQESLQGMEEVIESLQVEEKPEPVPEASAEDDPFRKDAEPVRINEDGEKQADRSIPEDRERVSESGVLLLSPAEVSTLKIQAASEDIQLEASPDEKIRILWDAESERIVRSSRQGGTLRVAVEEKSLLKDSEISAPDFVHWDQKDGLNLNWQELVGFIKKTVRQGMHRFSSALITIQLPAGFCPALEISTRSGDVEAAGVTPTGLKIHTASGNIDVRNAGSWNRADFASTSGDIAVVGSAESLTLSSISGDLSLTGRAGEVRLKTTSGDVEADLGCDKAEMSTVSGDIDAKVSGAGSLSAKSVSGDVELLWISEKPTSFSLSSASGDIENHCANDPSAAASVRVQTVSGDITVR